MEHEHLPIRGSIKSKMPETSTYLISAPQLVVLDKCFPVEYADAHFCFALSWDIRSMSLLFPCHLYLKILCYHRIMDSQVSRTVRSLSTRVAIVTGAGSAGEGIGNGRAAAILLAADGCNVVCVDLNYALAQRTAELALAEGGGKAIAVPADVTSEAASKGIVEKAI